MASSASARSFVSALHSANCISFAAEHMTEKLRGDFIVLRAAALAGLRRTLAQLRDKLHKTVRLLRWRSVVPAQAR